MVVLSLFFAAFLLFVAFFLVIRMMVSKAKEEGELVEEIKETRKSNELKDAYQKISSRPNVDADALLKRMREGNDNGK